MSVLKVLLACKAVILFLLFATSLYADNGSIDNSFSSKDSDSEKLLVRTLRNLQFGDVIPIRQGLVVVIEPATGNKTVLEGIDGGGRYGPAKFEVKGQPNKQFVVTLPDQIVMLGTGIRSELSSFTAYLPPDQGTSPNSSGPKTSMRDVVGSLDQYGKAIILVGGKFVSRGRQAGIGMCVFSVFVDYLP